MRKLLKLTNDYVFKRIFGKVGNEDITRSFIKAATGIEFKNINLEYSPILERELIESKMGILDVKVIGDSINNIDIEMQVVKSEYIADRILWYWAKMYTNTIKAGEGYDSTKRAICILIADFKLENLKENPTSLLIKTRPETLESVAEVLNRSYPDVATKTWGGPHNMLEMTPKGVHKATGLALIADDLGFKQKDIMAFGDEYNDVEMLEFAGRGVVMKNGSEQAKKVANDMTEYTNDEDGLARYLEKHLSL